MFCKKKNNTEIYNKIFGDSSYSFKTIDVILANVPKFDFTFIDNIEFQNLLFKDLPKANQVYVSEILYRGIYSGFTGLYRTSKWLEGAAMGYVEKNVFVFASAIRGLLESITDIFYAFQNASPMLRVNWESIYSALKGSLKRGVIHWELVENDFIHFIYGRKLEKGEQAPTIHKTKPASEYINNFEKFDINLKDKIKTLYKILCELTHPSATSVLLFTDSPDKLNFKTDWGNLMITEIIRDTKDIWEYLFQYGLNPVVVFLKTMNYCPKEEIHIPVLNKIDLDQIPLWKKQYDVIVKHNAKKNDLG